MARFIPNPEKKSKEKWVVDKDNSTQPNPHGSAEAFKKAQASTDTKAEDKDSK